MCCRDLLHPGSRSFFNGGTRATGGGEKAIATSKRDRQEERTARREIDAGRKEERVWLCSLIIFRARRTCPPQEIKNPVSNTRYKERARSGPAPFLNRDDENSTLESATGL